MHWSFRRGDSKSLGQDASKVVIARAMPQKMLISNLAFELFFLALSLHLKDLKAFMRLMGIRIAVVNVV